MSENKKRNARQNRILLDQYRNTYKQQTNTVFIKYTELISRYTNEMSITVMTIDGNIVADAM